MRRTWTCSALAALTLAAVGPAAAHAQSDAERAVRAAVERLFEGMRTARPEVTREVLAPDARFAVVAPSGEVTVDSTEGWLAAIGTSERRWDERVYDVEVRVDGAMASVWAPYTFYLDGAVRHCGINSLELLRGASGWKITQVSDTRRTEGCPDPLGGRG